MIESLQHLPPAAGSNGELAAQFTDLAPPLNARQAAVEAARCLYCYDAPCMNACPTGIDVASFIKNIHDGNVTGAAAGILKANIFGGSCARVCPTEILCEDACVRNNPAEREPVRIGLLQRYAIDNARFDGHPFQRAPATGKVELGPLADVLFFGTILFEHDWMVYVSVGIIAAVWAVLKYTRMGLILRAVGESHDAAHALGYKVRRIRMLAVLFGGTMAGLGGAYVSLIRVPQWTDGITAGAGWIALAIVVFASWKPWRVLLGAYLFGGITVLQLNLQAAGARIPVEYLSMSPYLITILVLVIMSSGKGKAALNAPAALGQNFHASR